MGLYPSPGLVLCSTAICWLLLVGGEAWFTIVAGGKFAAFDGGDGSAMVGVGQGAAGAVLKDDEFEAVGDGLGAAAVGGAVTGGGFVVLGD